MPTRGLLGSGWPLVLGLTAVPTAANGFDRFAYGLVLPAMQQQLGWSPFTAGSVSAANVAGYLLGAAVAARVLAAVAEPVAAVGSLLVATLTVASCAATGSLALLLVLRAVNGAAAAVAFIAGASLATRSADQAGPSSGARMLGLYFAGPGLGIALSAPLITPVAASGCWRTCWLLLGAAGAVCTAVTASATRRVPAAPARPAAEAHAPVWRQREIVPVVASYGVFGAGYITFMTFVVADLRAAGHASTTTITLFWSVLGMAGLIIGVAFVPALSRMRGGRAVALLTALTAAGSAIPLVSTAPAAALSAAALFGTFFSISTAATAAVRQELPPHRWPAAIAGLTTAFGLGQCAGPLLGGAVSETPQGLRAGLLTGTMLLAVSATVALLPRFGPFR